jgi:hypothetical protein
MTRALQGRQAAQVDAVGGRRVRALLGVGEDDLFHARGGDGEDAGAELVARLLLQEGRILPAVQEVLVGAAGGLQLDDLALLPAGILAHGEAAHRGAWGQRDGEVAFEHPGLGVLEAEVQLREGQGVLHHGAGGQGDEAQPCPIRGGQRRR